MQPDAFLNRKSVATSARNQARDESPKCSITNTKIIHLLDPASDLIASLSLMMLMQ